MQNIIANVKILANFLIILQILAIMITYILVLVQFQLMETEKDWLG